jgi:hypothetical protein
MVHTRNIDCPIGVVRKTWKTKQCIPFSSVERVLGSEHLSCPRRNLVYAFVTKTPTLAATKPTGTKPLKPQDPTARLQEAADQRRQEAPADAGGMARSSGGASPCDLDREFAPQIAQLLATPPLHSAQVLSPSTPFRSFSLFLLYYRVIPAA